MPDDQKRQIVAVMRQVMKKYGIGMSEMARSVGCDRVAVWGWHSGKHLPNTEFAQALLGSCMGIVREREAVEIPQVLAGEAEPDAE